jgi:hypothetical protein
MNIKEVVRHEEAYTGIFSLFPDQSLFRYFHRVYMHILAGTTPTLLNIFLFEPLLPSAGQLRTTSFKLNSLKFDPTVSWGPGPKQEIA